MRNLKKAFAAVAAAVAIGAVGGTAAAQGDNGGDGFGIGGLFRDRDGGACASSFPGFRFRLNVIGLTSDGRLICFSENRPDNARDIGNVTGLVGDTSLVGIDFRPANGELVGLGNAGGVYAVDPASGAATKKSQLSVPMTGTSFGVDFNPTVDRLRIVSDAGENLRVNVDTGAANVDSSLTYTAPPAAPVTATGVVGVAYTNNDADPNTATTLYDIDSMLDQVAIQSPPNNGILGATGKLGVDTSPVVGSDIYSIVRNGSTVDVLGFASLTTSDRSGFYSITLATGRATPRGTFAPNNQVIGIAIPLNQL